MKTEDLKWTGSDGQTYHGYLATPDNPNGGGVLVTHTLTGLDDVDKQHARDLADLGYTALAVDYIGDGRILTQRSETWPFDFHHASVPTHLRASMQGAHDILKKQPGVSADRTAAVGWGYGGLVAIELAKAGANLAGVVGIHSALPHHRPEENLNIKGKVLVLNSGGEADAPWSDAIVFQQQMDVAKVDWELTLLVSTDVKHREERAWRLTTDFLAEKIGPK